MEVRIAGKKKSLWQVSLGNGRVTSRLYSYNTARRIASRYNRLFRTDAAYAVR